jgi:hypothetical protein
VEAANDCSLYPNQIDARMYFYKRNPFGDEVSSYVHQIPSVETLQLEWNKPTENSLDPLPSEEWFPLLGELTDVQVTILVDLIGSLRLDYSANPMPATWPIGDTGLYYGINYPYPVASLDLDLELNLPHGIGWVDFEALASDPATPPSNETASTNVLSDRIVSLGGFLPRGVRSDGTPVEDFEPEQYWDRFVTFPPGPHSYLGPVSGGSSPGASATANLLVWSTLDQSQKTFSFPNPTLATGTIFNARLTSSSRAFRVASHISETGEPTRADAGLITAGELRYWISMDLIHRYIPKKSAAYARDVAADVVSRGMPAGDRNDPFWRKNYADLMWDYAIRLRSTSSETSAQNLALRDAEYFWRGVSGGYSCNLPVFQFLGETFVDPVNTAANSTVGVSTPVYNAMKEMLLFLGVKSTVPLEESAILERVFDGKTGYTLAGTPGEGLTTALAPTMAGYAMGMAFFTPEAINQRINDFIAGGGCFPDFSYADVLIELISPPAPAPSAKSRTRSASVPALLPLEAYIDTEPEARLSQRYFMREGGFTGPLEFSLDYDSGDLSLPSGGGGDAQTAAFRGVLTKSDSAFSVTRGTVAYTCIQDKFLSVTVTGPLHLSAGAARVQVGTQTRFLQPGIPLDLTQFDPDGVNAFVIAGLDGAALNDSRFDIVIDTAGTEPAIIGQTVYYAARERNQNDFRDSDGDRLNDHWENDYYGGIDRVNGAADDEGDGRTALEEYWLGGSPAEADARPPVQTYRARAGSNATDWVLTFARRQIGSDSYIIETSTDLATWTPTSLTSDEWDEDQSGLAPDFYRALVRIPLTSATPTVFARIRIWPGYGESGGGGGGGGGGL